MIVCGIIIAVASVMAMLCGFANYSRLTSMVEKQIETNELLKKLLRK